MADVSRNRIQLTKLGKLVQATELLNINTSNVASVRHNDYVRFLVKPLPRNIVNNNSNRRLT